MRATRLWSSLHRKAWGAPVTDDRSALVYNGFRAQVWDNRYSETARSCRSKRSLTHLIETTDRQDPMNVTCSVEGCGRPLYRCHEICEPHYNRLRRTGKLGGPDFRVKIYGNSICKADGCDRVIKGSGKRGMCSAHHQRWLIRGDTGTEPIKVPGAPKPPCSVDGCEGAYHSNGFCQTHHRRWRKWGDPHRVDPSPSGTRANRPGPESNNWHGDSVGYGAVHHRLITARGSARNQPCGHCGGSAIHWAYDHTDPEVRYSAQGRPYSLKQDCYLPLCASYHTKFDRAVGEK